MGSPAGWYPDPMQRYEQRYYDGSAWTEHVATGGTRATDTLGGATPTVASTTARTGATTPAGASAQVAAPAAATTTDGDPDAPGGQKAKLWGFAMVGCGAVLVIGAFLPWFTSWNGDLSGIGWGPGWVSLAMGLALVAYGAQGVISGRARVSLHGWAVAAIVIAFLVCGLANVVTETVADATLNSGVADTGSGLTFSFLATLVAIVPLVMLWKGDRRRRRAGIVGPPLLG